MKRILHSKILIILLAMVMCLAAAFGWIKWSNSTFTETFYSLYSSKIDSPVRVALLADLHQATFSEDNGALISRLEELHPDIILVAGDIISKEEADIGYAVDLCGQLAQVAQVYVGLGNHENEVVYGNDLNVEFLEENKGKLGENPEDFSPLIQDGTLLDGLAAAGVTVVQNGSVAASVNGNRIEIGGISTNVSSFWPYSGQFVYHFAENGSKDYKILISHRPEPVMEYIPGYPIDLVVSGHNHGGVIRIPGRGGLFSADEGLFPEYDAGLFERGEMTMIISRGLGGHSPVPRVFNPPELVIIDIL